MKLAIASLLAAVMIPVFTVVPDQITQGPTYTVCFPQKTTC